VAEKVQAQHRSDKEGFFEQIFTQYSDYVYRLAVAVLGDQAEAEDAVQEVFLRVYRALEHYDPQKAGLSTWLYQITLNYCRSRLRWRRVRAVFQQKVKEEVARPDTVPTPHPEEQVLQSELRQIIWQGINKLKEGYRLVLILHYYMDMPASEIATVLQIPEGTVYSRLHNARRRLREYLKRQGISSDEL